MNKNKNLLVHKQKQENYELEDDREQHHEPRERRVTICANQVQHIGPEQNVNQLDEQNQKGAGYIGGMVTQCVVLAVLVVLEPRDNKPDDS